MAGRLASKVVIVIVIVTGGATGIGRAVAGRARSVVADVTVESDVERLVQATLNESGQLDGALNNAGGVNATATLPGVDAGSWHADLAQNLTSVFYCLKYEIPAITATSGAGSIINNASVGGVCGIPGLAPYVAAKHGVVGLARSAALEGAARGIRVNALVTGNVDTPLYRALIGAPPDGELPGPAPNPTGRANGSGPGPGRELLAQPGDVCRAEAVAGEDPVGHPV